MKLAKTAEKAETGAQAAAMEKSRSIGTEKKRKAEEEFFSTHRILPRRGRRATPQSSDSTVIQEDSGNAARHDHRSRAACCCSRDGSNQSLNSEPSVEDEGIQIESTASSSRSAPFCRAQTTPSSEESMEVTKKDPSSPAKSSSMSPVIRNNTASPSDSELDQFFAAADESNKKARKEMSDKYNFNFERGVPMEGRFEWIKASLEEQTGK